jgi:hypothetical protein
MAAILESRFMRFALFEVTPWKCHAPHADRLRIDPTFLAAPKSRTMATHRFKLGVHSAPGPAWQSVY